MSWNGYKQMHYMTISWNRNCFSIVFTVANCMWHIKMYYTKRVEMSYKHNRMNALSAKTATDETEIIFTVTNCT